MSQEKLVFRQAASTFTARKLDGLPAITTYSDLTTAARRMIPPTTEATLTILTSGRPRTHVRLSSTLRRLLRARRDLKTRSNGP